MKLNIQNHRTATLACLTIAAALPMQSTGVAQDPNDIQWGNTGVGDWNVGTNWPEFGAVPQAATFNEIAIIDNGGTAFLNAAAVAEVGGVVIGTADLLGGALEIRDGGSLIAVDNGVTNGDVVIGRGAQTGVLTIDRGGSLTADVLSLNPGSSSVVLGGGAGAGVATINVQSAAFRSDTRFVGTNVSLSTNQLRFGGQTNLIAEITGTSHSVIDVSGIAVLDGELTLDFNGPTPSVGDSWTLIDASAIVSSFDQISTTANLAPGQSFNTRQAAGGNGTLLQATLDNTLTLKVDRTSGATTIVNESGASVSLSGYSITSASGSLNPTWNSLADQNVAGFQEANPTANALSELNTTGNTSATATGFSLGGAYDPSLPAFGTSPAEDLGFTFRAADGRDLRGIVEYEGDEVLNNMVLTIDPSTGDARLTNDSRTTLNLDFYRISSDSNSLLTTWDSLQDQGLGNWQEANPDTADVGELEPNGELALAGAAYVELDGLWNTSGVQDADDLTFLFRDPVLGQFTGIVEFATIVAGVEGDYNNNGTVDVADYAIWRDNLGGNILLANDATPGTVDESDYTVWKNNFGMSQGAGSLAGSAPVPEPATWALGLVAMGALLLMNRVRKPQSFALAANDNINASTQLSSQNSPRSFRMTFRTLSAAFAACLMASIAHAQPVTITGADTAGLTAPFTDGSITIAPLGIGGVPVDFGPSETFIGPFGNLNNNAINDGDGDPLTTDDSDSMEITLAAGAGLTQIEYSFTRANPIVLSGFTSDPLASFGLNPSGANFIAYNAPNNSLEIYHNSFAGATTQINFANSSASAGETISATVFDYIQAGPQLAFTSFTYDTPVSIVAADIAGDVDGINGVTIEDYNIIRDNFQTGRTRDTGDLTGDGDVTLADFDQWADNFAGSSAGLAGQLGVVPEPASIVLLTLLSIGGYMVRRG